MAALAAAVVIVVVVIAVAERCREAPHTLIIIII